MIWEMSDYELVQLHHNLPEKSRAHARGVGGWTFCYFGVPPLKLHIRLALQGVAISIGPELDYIPGHDQARYTLRSSCGVLLPGS